MSILAIALAFVPSPFGEPHRRELSLQLVDGIRIAVVADGLETPRFMDLSSPNVLCGPLPGRE